MIRIIGPTGRRRRLALFGTIFTGTVLLALILVPSAQANLAGSPSNFESNDGNMIHATGGSDWDNVDFTHVEDLFASNLDDSFTSGQKQDTTCPTIEGHKNPPKDDFTDVASFSEVNATTGDTYLYGATIRFAANGNASENVELKQSAELCPGADTLTARTAGDKLIAIDYLNGGTNVVFHVLTWVTSGACFVGSHTAPCWGATVLTLTAAGAEGRASQSAISAANNPISGENLVAGQFAEFGVNLATAGIIPRGDCETFNQTVWESRASGSSFVSTTKDVAIEDNPISNCASVSVRKIGSDGGSQEGVVFTLYEGTGILGDVVGTCTVDASGDCLPSFTDLTPGDYTLDESNTPAGYSKDATLPYSFTLGIGENASFEFTNVLQSGAIVIAKTAKHADTSGNTSPNLVAGFTITDSGGGETTTSTDSDGAACVDGLPPGDATVSETDPPAGYSADADQDVTVVGGTTCTNADGVVASFDNTPLTDITVSVDSQVEGGTSSTISCDDPDATSGSTDATGDGSVTASDLEPGTYVCTVVVDP
jgi:hypothetical protein